MIRLTASVFGPYLHGKLKGQTNPKSRHTVSVHGQDEKDAIKRLKSETNGAFYQIDSFKKVAA